VAQRKKEKAKSGNKKHGRNRRPVDKNMSYFVKGVIDFSTYEKKKGNRNI